ncbi:hypothetical protein EV175_001116 [Coemansia sp. RSA 1933]|nr:hypothetical protein EV175_001116 [Coemansia sp. RSA 1933]
MLRNDSSKPAATRGPGNVLRRSKTSIRNPIKKLFRSSSNAKTLDEGNADLQPNIPTRAPKDQQRLTQRSSSSDTLFSTRNMERQNYSLTPTLPTIHSPSTAAADVYPFQPDHWQQQKQRPPSVHSTKSVRNIFSSAKQRLSLRKSTFFPRQTHQPSDSVNLSAMSEAPLLSASTDQTHHAELSMATGIGINADSISIPLDTIDDHMSVIDLVDISILDEPDNASEIAVPVGSPSTTAITNDNTDSMMLVFCDDDAASYKEERGYVAPAMLNYSRRFCSSGTFPTNPSIPEEDFDDDPDKSVNAQSPYAVRDIDELLVELGVAETALIFDTVKDKAQNRESFCPRIPTTSCSIRSSISLKEIDELIEQLEMDRPGASASLDATKAAAFSASIADTIRSLGNVASLTRVIVPQPLPIDPLDVSTVMRGLGSVIVPDFACVRPRLFLDVAGLVSGLGAAIVPELLKDRWCLSLAAAATAAAMPSEQPSRRTGDTIGRSGSITVEDITRLITELGAVIVPKEPVVKPAPLDVASLVRGLGNPEAVIPTVVPSIICEQQPSRCLDIPDIIAGLGGVYVPTLSASVIDRIGEVDIHALFDTNADDVSDSGSCTSSSYWNTWTLSSLPDMDVDEIVSSVESSRSRANSIITTVSETPSRLRQHANYHNDGISISRLIYALNIAPIFVRRPLLGPSRVVVFPHFY